MGLSRLRLPVTEAFCCPARDETRKTAPNPQLRHALDWQRRLKL
jgi:hypothetical protein